MKKIEVAQKSRREVMRVAARFQAGNHCIFGSSKVAKMRDEILFKWRIKWGGRWTKTSIHYTEEHIRKEHPEATVIDGSRIVRQVPDTPEEMAYALYGNPTGGFLHPSHRSPADAEKPNQPEGQSVNQTG